MYATELASLVNVLLGGFLLALGALALRWGGAPGARPWLAAYLALVGANYLVDNVEWLARFVFPDAELKDLAWLANCVDPACLVLFAVATRRGHAPARLALPLLGLGTALAAASIPLGERPPAALYAAWVAGCYLSAFALLAERWLRGPEEARERLGVVVLAFAPVCLPRLGLVYLDLGFGRGAWRATSGSLVMEAGLLVAFAAFALAAHAWSPPTARERTRRLVAASGALLLVVEMVWALRFMNPLSWMVYPLVFSARWLLFLAVVTAAMRSGGVLGLPASAGPSLRRFFVLLLTLGAVAVVASLFRALQEAPPSLAPLIGAGLVGLVAMGVAALRFALPRRSDGMAWRREEAYRARALLGDDEGALEELRLRLGITPSEARRLRELAAAERAAAPPAVEPGALLLGRYEVERVVGAGSFGRVFSARDRLDGSPVVVKELRPEWAAEPAALASFRREAGVLLAVSHPNVVAARALEPVSGGGHVLVLERVEGETLAARLERRPLAPREARRLAEDLLAGLDALHRRGLVHRDVKPANVMLRPDGRAVLVDLGSVGGRGTRPVVGHPGTRRYESPEQARGEPLGPASDLYSATLVLREALGSVPPAWQAALSRALEEDPRRRFPDAGALLQALPREGR